jgi:hypothetical protein
MTGKVDDVILADELVISAESPSVSMAVTAARSLPTFPPLLSASLTNESSTSEAANRPQDSEQADVGSEEDVGTGSGSSKPTEFVLFEPPNLPCGVAF